MSTPSPSCGLAKFDGIWKITTRSQPTSTIASLVVVIDTQHSIFSAYPGSIHYVRMPVAAPASYPLASLLSEPVGTVDVPVQYSVDDQGYLAINTTLDPALPNMRWSLDRTGRRLYASGAMDPVGGDNFLMHVEYRRLDRLPATIVQYAERPCEIDWNRSDLLLAYYFDMLNETYASFTPCEVRAQPRYSLRRTARLARRYVSGKPVRHQACIRAADRSNHVGVTAFGSPNGFPFFQFGTPGYRVTLFYLDVDENPFTPMSRVTISGFCGPWAVVNGEWDLDPAAFTWTLQRDGFPAKGADRIVVAIQLDTSALPVFDRHEHGRNPRIESTLTLRPKSDLPELLAALHDVRHSMGIQAHTCMFDWVVVDATTGRARTPTYAALNAALNDPSVANGFASNIAEQSGSFGGTSIVPFYNDPAIGYTVCGAQLVGQMWNPCNPYDIDPFAAPYAGTVIPYNYVVGGAAGGLYRVVMKAQLGGFLFAVAPLNGPTPDGYAPAAPFIGYPSGPVFGLLQAKPGGRRVAYVLIYNYEWFDAFGPGGSALMFDPAYNPPGDIYYNIKSYVGTMTSYLQQVLRVDDFLLDQRINNGGLSLATLFLGKAFGARRRGNATRWPRTLGPRRRLLRQADSAGSTLPLISQSIYDEVDPAVLDAAVPGSVVRGSRDRPRRVVFLTSISAVSAADHVLGWFVGDRLDGDLGANVHASFVGSVDGRLAGDGLIVNPPVNTVQPILQYQGQPMPPFTVLVDTWLNLKVRGSKTNFAQYNEAFRPARRFPDKFEILYRDLGFLPADRKYRVGPPRVGEPTTWADTWLELTIDYFCDLACSE